MESPLKTPSAGTPVIGHMDFPDAIRRVMDGKKVTKLEWNDPNIYLLIHDNFLSIHKEGNSVHPLLVSTGDMMGNDWIEVSESGI